jgi:hypothetical protein
LTEAVQVKGCLIEEAQQGIRFSATRTASVAQAAKLTAISKQPQNSPCGTAYTEVMIVTKEE